MEFKVKINNFGKIKHASLDVKPLTIIAGENSSGKSFATKGLYCVLEALNQDHLTNSIASLMDRLLGFAERFKESLKAPSKQDMVFDEKLFDYYLPQLAALVNESRASDLNNQGAIVDSMKLSFGDIRQDFKSYIKSRENVKRMAGAIKYVSIMLELIERLEKVVLVYDATIAEGVERRLSDNFKKNFQVTDLSALKNQVMSGASSLELEKIGDIKFEGVSGINFNFAYNGIVEIQNLDNVIFIDSPVYLKIRSGLAGNRMYAYGRRNPRYLSGYPLYVDHLYSLIDERFIDEPDFSEISQELQKALCGRLVVSKTGDIDYFDNEGNSVPLSLTAMGISNLGLIELLIRNNVIKKGSFLIIDEPEVHLHPKWQVEMMDVLFKIADAGANVIVATHSLDMLKKVELILRSNKDAEDKISINHMPAPSSEESLSQLEKAERVIKDLSTPFYEMYLESI